ncbi:MAG: VOC family protein [Parvularculaceae bacterium]|nr:VOC family protein [Parvularculaceae bacterium]
MSGRLNYVELPAAALPETKAFYEAAFGWTLEAFGPSYSGTTTSIVDLGLQGDRTEAPRAPLPGVEVDDLGATLLAVTRAGGRVTKDVFSFPGGRRFHCVDPSGNEIAVWQRA